MKQQIFLKEIARIAKVSPSTVSLVLNNRIGVGSEKREIILKLLEEHGYRTESKKMIMFLKYRLHGKLVEENQGFIASIFESIERSLQLHGYGLVTQTCDQSLEQGLCKIDFSHIGGMIVLGTELQYEQYPVLNQIPIPYIVLDNNMLGMECCTVGINNEESVRNAFSLCSGGKVTYFKSSLWTANFQERCEVVEKIAKEMRLTVETVEVDPTLVGAYDSIKREPPKTIAPFSFADNDIIALGVIKALQDSGFRIPQDCQVVGFDNIPFAAISTPSLTTVAIPRHVIGNQAVDMIIKCIENTEDYKHVKSFISGSLIIRESAPGCAEL